MSCLDFMNAQCYKPVGLLANSATSPYNTYW